VIDRKLIPDIEDVEALRDSFAQIEEGAAEGDPAAFFDFGSALAIRPAVVTRERRSLRGGTVYRRQVESHYRPPGLGAPRPVASHEEPREPILFEHWVHEGRPARGTVIALHGFAMGQPRLGAFALFAREWYQRGLDVVLLTLPEHGERRPPHARFSGECFAVPDGVRLAEAVREAIFEIFVVERWLRARLDAPIGLLGLSLGGYLTSLSVGLSGRFDFAIPMAAPACMGDLAWRVFQRTRHVRPGAEGPLDESTMRASFRVHSPLAHPLRIPRERVLIVAGRGDRVVPPEHPTALWEHWGKPPVHWFNGSHTAPFGRKRIVGAIDTHLRRIGVL